MAAKRAKKSKKTKAKRTVRRTAKKAKATKRPGKRTKAKAAKRAPVNRAKAPVRKAKKAAKPVRKAARKEVIGEGNYTASREFRNAETSFVKKNKARIPAMGKAAEKALDGPEGDDLRHAEQEAKSHAHVDGAQD
jgi:serine kinase of HPr protein (carbohydrate metabolism regulator)